MYSSYPLMRVCLCLFAILLFPSFPSEIKKSIVILSMTLSINKRLSLHWDMPHFDLFDLSFSKLYVHIFVSFFFFVAVRDVE